MERAPFIQHPWREHGQSEHVFCRMFNKKKKKKKKDHNPENYLFPSLVQCDHRLTLKEPGGGAESAPLRHFLLYLCWLLFFRAETSWLFSFKPCAWFKTIFIKIGPRVMTRRCVIARWVQRKNWFSIEITHKSRFFVFFVFQDTLPLCFILFIWFIWSKNMCKHTLTHIIAKKCNFCLKK